jgi:hypothetical protein
MLGPQNDSGLTGERTLRRGSAKFFVVRRIEHDDTGSDAACAARCRDADREGELRQNLVQQFFRIGVAFERKRGVIGE